MVPSRHQGIAQYHVLLVVEHPTLREAFKTLLAAQPSVHTVTEVTDSRAAVSTANKLKPQVILVDADTPDTAACQLIVRDLRQQLSESKVILLTADSTADMCRFALDVGAAVLLKLCTLADLTIALQGELPEIRIAPSIVRGVTTATLEDLEPVRQTVDDIAPACLRGMVVSISVDLEKFGHLVMTKAREAA